MDKSPGKKSSRGRESEKDLPNKNEDIEDEEEEEVEEMAIDDIREHILGYYGINQEEEHAVKEKKAQKFRSYVNNSGLQLAFQLIISEIMGGEMSKEEHFSYASRRMKEIGREYQEVKDDMAKTGGGKNVLVDEGVKGEGKKKKK